MKTLALGLRFFLEVFMLVAVGVFAWQTLEGVLAWVAAIGIPLSMAVVWATFAVPGDQSRGGDAPVPVSGVVRLVIEVAYFGVGLLALANLTSAFAVIAFTMAIFGQYVILGDRMRWLLDQSSSRGR